MTKEDYSQIKALYEEPGTLQYMNSFFETDDDRAFFESYVENMYRFYDFGMYALEDKKTGKIIGHVGLGLTEVDSEESSGRAAVTLGYVIGSAYRRGGLAYRACCVVLMYAKKELGLEEILVQVHRENVPSIALARRLVQDFPGFVRLSLAN